MLYRKLLLSAILLPMLRTQAQVTPPKPFGPVPTVSQWAWQQMEYYMFIHFGPNTFTDKEWGHGDEDPKVFNPTQLDARQWVRTAKAAGMKGIIITAKHHDGFCLWPSKYSTHTVRESGWKDGKGDVLRELSEACREGGIKFGVYLSPWDRNHAAYGTAAYNTVFANTLNEVLSGYGPVFEQWFDGANGEGPNGKKQQYEWPLFHNTVYHHQPQAVIFSDVGPGARWVGNENGFAGTTNWSRMHTKGFTPGAGAPPTAVLNSGQEDGNSWVPAECDVSIRPGWFYSPATDSKVKTVAQLMEIYEGSVGRNGNLLLNVPVDRRGLIPAIDSARLMAFREVRERAYGNNLARNKPVQASQVRGNNDRYVAARLTDGNIGTYWCTNDGVDSASLVLNLGAPTLIDRVVLQEYLPLGQRIKSFVVESWDGTAFQQLAEGTTVGYKRILSFKPVTTAQVRVRITQALAAPILSEVQVFNTVGQ